MKVSLRGLVLAGLVAGSNLLGAGAEPAQAQVGFSYSQGGWGGKSFSIGVGAPYGYAFPGYYPYPAVVAPPVVISRPVVVAPGWGYPVYRGPRAFYGYGYGPRPYGPRGYYGPWGYRRGW
jgi:hypothetical protein